MFAQAGFEDYELVAETGFNSSPKTKGTLFRAKKPHARGAGHDTTRAKDPLTPYQEFMDAIYREEGVLGRKNKHLVALAASLAAGCDSWAQYCLAVARQLGATEQELNEVLALAMSVGATKIRIQQENALASLDKGDDPEITGSNEIEPATPERACST